MRRGFICIVATAVLMGCGGNTGPKANPNPNPSPKRYTIAIDGGTFTPDTLRALVGDVILWQVTSADQTQHQVTFCDIPSGVPTPTPTKLLTAGQSDSTIFLKDGTYKYLDEKNSTSACGAGVVIVSPLP